MERAADIAALTMIQSQIEQYPVAYSVTREEIDTRAGDTRGRKLCAPLSDLALGALVRALEVLVSGGNPAVLDGSRLLTTTEAAAILGVSRPTLTAMCDRGEIPCSVVGRRHRRVQLAELMRRK